MTIQTTSITATPKQHWTRFISAAAGAVLALTAAAGVGAWQLGRDSGTRGGEPPVAARPARTFTQRTAEPAADIAPTVYLVASPAHAAALEAALEEANAFRATLAESPLAQRVALLASAEAEAGFLQALCMDDNIRGGLGLSPTRVIDLRQTGTAAAPPATSGTAVVTAAGETAHDGMADLARGPVPLIGAGLIAQLGRPPHER